ncbi:MAG: hypothetical protein E7231_13865 [Cellulosilyticum sp.]|nr:hypothetical protein [Cellulosilyticum sp.]
MKKSIIAMIILSLVGMPQMSNAVEIDYSRADYTSVGLKALPSQYDGRAYCSTVKDQKSEGSCWIYIANALLESRLMKQNYIIDKDFYDFSEEAMDKATSIEYGGKYGFVRKKGDAGYFDIALNYWTRSALNGPIQEATGQKIPCYVMQTAQIDEVKENRQKLLNQIKQFVYEYGAVTASFYCSTYSEGEQFYSQYPYYCQQDLAYYYPGNEEVNHGSLIVGWNDQYPKEKFNVACRPTTDGAFLVKNSWGREWGNKGYFWMSYETPIYDLNAIIDIATRGFYDTIYEYDKHGMIGSVSVSDESKTSIYMNQYEAYSKKELLTALSTYITFPDNIYKLYVSTDGKINHLKEVSVKNAEEISGGKGYKIDYAGYKTFELEQPLEVSGKFLVAIEVASSWQGACNIPVEVKHEGYCENIESRLNQGYIARNISELMNECMYDLGKEKMNICLKAFTKKDA